MNSLTLAYVTFRKNPKFQWWADSLLRQATGKWSHIHQIVVVAFEPTAIDSDSVWRLSGRTDVRVMKPMPSVWQGEHRLTKADYFDVATARNTAICMAGTTHIAFCDDLSVLRPGWMDEVLKCLIDPQLSKQVICGAYRKVKGIEVDYGQVIKFEDHPSGIDHRLALSPGDGPNPCRGQWAFGCSIMAPVEAFLSVNGYDQDTGGLGYEDVVLGQMLEQRGHEFMFAPKMMTWESEELHHDTSNPRFLRWDPGVSPNDKSHAILNLVRGGRNYAPNYYGEGGLRDLRNRVLAGQPFPIIQSPQHEWFTGTPLKNLPLE